MSAVASPNEFLDSLLKSGLIDQQALDRALSSYTGTTEDPNKIAEFLLTKKLITNFQAKSLLAGRYKGLIIGPYRILDKIGAGGMGIVYLAEHEKLQRRVAIKVLPEDKIKDKLALERFYREARAAAALDHPNIVKAHDVCEHNGMHFLVMEYIDGANLQKYVDTKGPLPWKTALNIVIQSCRGLQHAFERNMVHRDIKPGNILVDKSGQVKILDLGLARSFEQKKDNLTQDLSDGKDVMGSIDYISPEQAIGSNKIDIRADIYSLGATLYTLVTGKPPVEGSTAQKLLQHQLKMPSPLHKLEPEVPEEVSKAVLKMLAKKPDQRYATPAEVVSVLTPFVVSNSQHIPQISGVQFNSGSIRSQGTPNEVSLDTLPVADLLAAEENKSPTTGSLLRGQTTGIIKKTKKFKKKKVQQANVGSMVWVIAGVAITLLAVSGIVYLFMNMGKGGTDSVAVKSGDTTYNPNASQGRTPDLGRNNPASNSPALPPANPVSNTNNDPPFSKTGAPNMGADPGPTKDNSNTINTGRPLTTGYKAPEIKGFDIVNDQLINLSDYRGKVVLLVFWHFQDPVSVSAFPLLRKMVNSMQSRQFAVMGVNMDVTTNVTLRGMQQYNYINWRSIRNISSQGVVTDPLAVTRGLRIVLIDANGVIRKASLDHTDEKKFVDEVEKEMAKVEGRSRN